MVARTRQLDPLNPISSASKPTTSFRTVSSTPPSSLYKESIKHRACQRRSLLRSRRSLRICSGASMRRSTSSARPTPSPVMIPSLKRSPQGQGRRGISSGRSPVGAASARRAQERVNATKYVSPLDFARVYAQLGDRSGVSISRGGVQRSIAGPGVSERRSGLRQRQDRPEIPCGRSPGRAARALVARTP